MKKIYLDDIRTPVDTTWVVVRSYDEFVEKVLEIGLENIETISLSTPPRQEGTFAKFRHTTMCGE